MPNRFQGSMITVAMAAMAGAVISVPIKSTQAQTPAATGQAFKTPWGEPDLQGIWTDETDTPLQRSPKYASQEFFTEAQRAELDRERSELLGRESCGAWDRARCRRLLQLSVLVREAHRRTHVEDCRSTQRPASVADARGSKGGGRRSGVLSRPYTIGRHLQEQVGGLQRRPIRSDTVAATRRTCAAL
jgi:hypothetical protein